MTSITVDSDGAMALVPFARKKLAQLKEMGLMSKTIMLDGYMIDVLAMDDVEKIRITSPHGTLISAGLGYTLITDYTGAIWAWGYNGKGNLGVGDVVARATPTPVVGGPWKSIAAGTNSSVAVHADGTVWSWGDNSYRQLGFLDYTNRNTPTKVVSMGGGFSAVPQQTYEPYLTAMHSDGKIWDLGSSYSIPASGRGGSNVNAPWGATIGLSEYRALAINLDGILWALYGYNSSGELGLGYTGAMPHSTPVDSSIWTSISAGLYHVMAIKKDGTLWAWGNNAYGQLGVGDTVNRLSPTRVGTDTWAEVSAFENRVVAIKKDGTLWAWGRNSPAFGYDSHSPINVAPGAWYTASIGLSHAVAMRMDSTLWAWGDNIFGQLGTGDTISSNVPVKVILPTRVRAGPAPGSKHIYPQASRLRNIPL